MQQEAVLGGRFRLERRAGAGGMGEVWRALDQETGEPVAVKVLPGHGPEDAARFAREAQILAELSHSRVVRYVAHGGEGERAPYLVMEWLDGEDLSARLARGPLSAEESVRLALEVAEVLGFAHERGVVHRDLKPSNLFLPGGRVEDVKVLDFGIAHASRATRMTRTGMLMGTPGYMAPEQARGEASLDARADVFSLGCVLFECLAGEPAFEGQHAAAILTKVLFEETPSVRSVRPEVPAALDDLLRRMLAKRREERPLDGRAAATALRSLGELPSERPGESVRSPSLTGSEQRAMAVILVSPPATAEATSHGSVSTTLVAPDETTLLREAASHGGAAERLLDGSVVVMMAGTGLATDLCAQAARCALSLRAHAAGRRVALAMGRGERTVRSMGPAIDRVARLSGATASRSALEDAVVIDEVVAGLLDARFEVQEAEGVLALRGERTLAEGTRLLLGKPTPCVGRERELGALRALFTECVEEGTAQAALVIAPPGVGKSRLAQEFLQDLRGRGEEASIWIARGDALRAGSPMGMLGQVLRCACGIHEGEPLPARRQKLSAQVAAWVAPGDRRRVEEFLGEIIGAPFPDEDSVPLRAARVEAQLMADQVRAAFLDFVGVASQKGPVLVLLEDLHWGDRTTVQLLDAALRALEERPLFILALARPEIHELFPALWEGRRLHDMRLIELSRRAGERLARHVLGDRADADLIARIVRLSEGNAFYLEELIRWTAEGKGSDMPETVVAMVESRLGALDEGARRLLRAASIFGEVFWTSGVTTLVGGEGHRGGVTAALATLVKREILVQRRESRFPGEEELSFRHALLREGAYAMLTEGDRALGHRLAGEWLEARGEQDARALAEHFEKGGDGPAAGRHYLRAVQQAIWGSSVLEAVALARRGLALPLPSELRVQLLGALCGAAIWMPHLAISMQHEAEELMQIAPRESAPWIQGMVPLLHAATAGRFEDVLTLVGKLEVANIAPDAVYPMALTLTFAIHNVEHMGRFSEGEALHAKLAALVQAAENRSASVMSLFLMSSSDREAKKGDPIGMLEFARKGQELARQCGDRRLEVFATLAIAMCTWCLGSASEGERMLKALPLSDTEFGSASAYRPFLLSWMLAERGALAEARAYADYLTSSLGRARGLALDEGRGRWALAEVHRRAGEHEEAEREIEAALKLLGAAVAVDVPGALATKAALKLAQGKPSEALAAAEEGMARLAATGMHDHFFRSTFLRLVHIESLEANGRHDEARAALANAQGRLLAIAARITDPAGRKSCLENVPENRRILELSREWLGEAP